jgi:hypothetical protein
MHKQAGTSLHVPPMCWTDQHPKLFNIRFEQLPRCDMPMPPGTVSCPPSQGHLRPSNAIQTLINSLDELKLEDSLNEFERKQEPAMLVKVIMSQLWPNAFQSSHMLPELDIHFGAENAAAFVPLIWNFPMLGIPTSPYTSHGTATKPYPTSLPMICYIGKRHLASARENLFRVKLGPKGIPNHPVARLWSLHLKKLSPTNGDQDPHLAGIFLAMAQRHFLVSGDSNKDPPYQDVKLRILMEDADKSAFVVYTATVTREFLERFHAPFSTPGNSTAGMGELPGMTIEYTDVPFWPILGLRERMGLALGKDIVGSFNPNVMKTWMDEDSVQTDKPNKRKRLLSVRLTTYPWNKARAGRVLSARRGAWLDPWR